MNSQKSSSIFDDELMDFLDSTEMEVQEVESIEDSKIPLLDILQSKVTSEEKLARVQVLVSEYLPKLNIKEVEGRILQHLMPYLDGLILDIFEDIEQRASSDQQKSNETLVYMKHKLQACVSVHELMQTVLTILLHNEMIELVDINSLPQATARILLTTFSHCKKSNNEYKVNFEECKEILTLFKEAQAVHASFLKLLENSLHLNELDDQQIALYGNVLEMLGATGLTLNKMNNKSLTDNWKCYAALVHKYSTVLMRISFNVRPAFDFLFSETLRNLSRLQEVDQKVALMLVKLSSFFLRIAIRLCETVWPAMESYYCNLFEFFVSLYTFSQPILERIGYSESLAVQVSSLIFSQCDVLLDKLLMEPKFHTACRLKKEMKYVGCLFYLVHAFKRLLALIKADPSCLGSCDVSVMIALLFDVVNECYSQMFWNVKIGPAENLYNALVFYGVSTILTVDQQRYSSIEKLLFTNTLKSTLWTSLLATDIWCSVLRKHPNLCYTTLINLIESNNSLLKNYVFDERPEVILLEHLLYNLYGILSISQKVTFLDKYPIHLHTHVWRVLGLDDFPKEKFYEVESLLITVTDKMKEFLQGTTTKSSILFLCSCFDLLGTLPGEFECDVKHFMCLLLEFWNFNVAAQSKNCAIFRYLLYSLCGVTKNFSYDFNGTELFLILSKLKQLLNADFEVKIEALEMLSSLSSKSFVLEPNRNAIMAELSDLFRILLSDRNVIIQQEALAVYTEFFNASPHRELVIRNDAQLQSKITNFLNSDIPASSVTGEEYFSAQKAYKFEHSCKELPAMMHQRPLNGDEDVTEVVKRIKNDIQLLNKLTSRNNRLLRNTTPIFNMLGQSFNLKF